MRMYEVFRLGMNVQYVRLCAIGKPYVKGEYWLLESLERLKGEVEECKLNSKVQQEVSAWIKKLSKDYKNKEEIRPKDREQLAKDGDRWRDLLHKELLERVLFEFLPSGALNQKELQKTSEGEPSVFFEEKIWNVLSQIEKSDFSNSAKCLLCGLPTPAVMVALRGTEATVKKYYEHKTGDNAQEKLWGPMIEELRKRSEELKIRATFLGYLDYIRDAKRNFAEHPNKIYDQRDAELLFMETVNLVQDTYAEMV